MHNLCGKLEKMKKCINVHCTVYSVHYTLYRCYLDIYKTGNIILSRDNEDEYFAIWGIYREIGGVTYRERERRERREISGELKQSLVDQTQ